MKTLRVQVERVVRPIRASNLRKDRIREELLTHLTRLFDEEQLRTGDAETAAAEAIRRFGDAPSLTRELQASVPWLERVAFFSVPRGRMICRKKGESPLAFVLRSNAWAAAIGAGAAAPIALLGAIAASRRPHRIDQPSATQLLIFMSCVFAIELLTMLALGLLSEAMRQALERRAAAKTSAERRSASGRVAGYAIASSAVLGAAFGALLIGVGALIPFQLITQARFLWITGGVMALGLPLTLVQARDWKAATRRFDNWESLDLDELPSD